MRVLRSLIIGFLSLFAGMILGLIGYMIGGAPEGADNWQNWQYLTCYIIPFGVMIAGAIWAWKTGEDYSKVNGDLE